MTSDGQIFLIYNQENNSNRFKMTKGKTAVFMVMIICSCELILSITDALPTPEPFGSAVDDTKLGNNSRLVITHVVKTIEFEVGIVDDVPMDSEMENSTDSDPSQFYETDIQLLNVDLLKEIVKQATAEENLEETMNSTQQTTNEGNSNAQLQNASLPFTQQNS